MKISITSGQEKQYKRFVEDAAERALGEAGIDKDGIQKLIERGDEFQNDIAASIKKLSVSNQFANEEVASSYVYPDGYRIKGMTEQTNILRQLLPGIGFADEELVKRTLPLNAEGWFAIPKWQTMANTYGEAVEKVFAAIKIQRKGKFYNWREGQLSPQYLRQTIKSAKMFQKLGEEQKDHDILVVPAQFGLRHRGRSVRRAREVMNASEFGLGAFAVGIMLLTHPERLVDYENLWAVCAGDEFAPDAVGRFPGAPYFEFNDDGVGFGAGQVSLADGSYGSASGFLPQ